MASQVTKSGGAYVAPSSTAQFTESYPDRGQMGRLTERVTLTASTSYATLGGKIPARCKVMMCALKVIGAVGLVNSPFVGPTCSTGLP